MMSLGVFLQPMSQEHGLVARRHRIRRGAQLPGHGIRVVLLGIAVRPVRHARGRAGRRRPARHRTDRGQPCGRTLAVPAAVRDPGRIGGGQLLCADDGDGHPLVHRQPQPRRGTRLGRHGARLGADRAAVTLDHQQLRLARCDAGDRRPRLDRDHSRLPVRAPPARLAARCRFGGRCRGCRPRLHHGPGAAHAAVRRDRADPLRLLRGAFRSDLPHGELRDGLRRAVDGRGHRVRRRRPGVAERPHRMRPDRGSRRRQADADHRACGAGACRQPVPGDAGRRRASTRWRRCSVCPMAA